MKVNRVKTIKVIPPLPCLFLHPIAAHDFTIFLSDKVFYVTFVISSCEEHCSFDVLLREWGHGESNVPHFLI